MPNERFDENTKVRAVRLMREHAGDYDSEWVAMRAVSADWDNGGDVTQVGATGRGRRRRGG